MIKLTAKNVTDDFWIVQNNGRKVGNIRIRDSGVEFQNGSRVERFRDLTAVNVNYDIVWQRIISNPPQNESDVFGYPTKTLPHNPEFDVHRQLPLFTSETDSKSKQCAGYYLVNLHKKGWTEMFCPKLITLDRYSYYGPYMDPEHMKARLQAIQNDSLYQTTQ